MLLSACCSSQILISRDLKQLQQCMMSIFAQVVWFWGFLAAAEGTPVINRLLICVTPVGKIPGECFASMSIRKANSLECESWANSSLTCVHKKIHVVLSSAKLGIPLSDTEGLGGRKGLSLFR